MHVVSSAIPDFAGQTIDDGRLKLVEVIGEGAHGIVYRAIEESSAGSSSSPEPREYAVKVLLKADEATIEGQCQAREIMTHKLVSDHPNVLTLHKVIEDDWFVYLVTDYCPGGDLFRLTIEQAKYARNDDMTKALFVQILDAVQSIHAKGIYHRDLKPDNIFVNADATKIYLGDFGLATDVYRSNAHGCGTSHFMSPECIGLEFDFMPYPTLKADTWALGIILVSMITGRLPWAHATSHDEHFSRYLSDNDFLGRILPISKGANNILKQIFTFNPFQRISIDDLRNEILDLDTFFMTQEEIANSDHLVQNAAALYAAMRAPTPLAAGIVLEVPVKAGEAPVGGAGYPDIRPEDVYALVSPDPDSAPPSQPPSLHSASRNFVIGSTSLGSLATSGSSAGSSEAESSGPLTPEAHAVDDDKLPAVPTSLQGHGLESLRATESPKGPTPIYCLVLGINDISVF